MVNFELKHYCINDFSEWHERKELEITPKFQRRSVWSDKARSYLMDTIIRGLPIPKIYLRHEVDPETRKSIREIVDGQQRIRTILLYLDNGFKISKTHNKEYGGLYFDELPRVVQKGVLEYEISVDILSGASDSHILDIFSRLNTYTITLNKQEMLNAKYFGLFKKTVYSLGYEFGDYWTDCGVLTERTVARMGDAELASELVIQLLEGTQDRKSIEKYYKKYDDEFKTKNKTIKRFREVMDIIMEIMDDYLETSHFSSKPLYYTLFGVINELNPKGREYSKIFSVIEDIDDILDSDTEDLKSKEFKFYDASTKHVTDITSRIIRHEFIKKAMLKRLKK